MVLLVRRHFLVRSFIEPPSCSFLLPFLSYRIARSQRHEQDDMNLGGLEKYQDVTGSSCGYDSHIVNSIENCDFLSYSVLSNADSRLALSIAG